jgi:hypothetical protein
MKWIAGVFAFAISLFPVLAAGDDIDGVQPVAIDQPRINVVLRRGPAAAPLMAGDGQTFNVEAFLDTGASSIALSPHTADQLGVDREKIGGDKATFQDVGVGGGSQFNISEPLFYSIAPMTPNVDTDHADAIAATYNLTVGPLRAEVGPLSSGMDILTALAVGDMDIVGMPALYGKIVVLDNRDVNAMDDKIRTFVYDAKSARTAPIPKTSQHVRLTYVSFAPFTRISPPTAQGPAIWANPLIGPNPFARDAATPPIVVTQQGKTSSGSWLLDTGAAVSMISRAQAARLGVQLVAGSDESGHPRLAGVADNRQFVMTVGGIGGSKKAAGFFLDKLSVPTMEGQPIVFDHAPVLVADITVKDAGGHAFTLDGVFGMNFLVATAMVDESSLLPDIDHLTPGAFRWIVFNQPAGWLGLERNP